MQEASPATLVLDDAANVVRYETSHCAWKIDHKEGEALKVPQVGMELQESKARNI